MLGALTALLLSAAMAVELSTVDPSRTGPGIVQFKGPHRYALVEKSGTLVITIGGTGSRPDEFTPVHAWAAQLGHDVWALDYFNGVICTSCRSHTDPTCFDRYRRELMLGDTSSEVVTMEETNAILHRLRALANYQAGRHSHWRRYWTGNDLRWDRVILVGHSQGAGHAAYLAKLFAVKRVVMTGGPHDVGSYGAGPWLSAPGATLPANYRAFLHRDDFFGATSQLAAVRLLLGQDIEPTMVDRIVPAGAGPVIMTTMAHRDPHNSFQRDELVEIWRWMLAH